MKHLTNREKELYESLKELTELIRKSRINIADVELLKLKTKAIEITEKHSIK